jgi:hypothetical protein
MANTNPEQSDRFFKRISKAIFRPRQLVLLALAVSLPFAQPLLDRWLPELAQNSDYQLEVSQISINKPPHWVPHNLVEQMVIRAKLPPTLSLLDEELTERIALAFAEHPWIAEVVEVRKSSFPARVDVQLIYREPVALVEKRTGFYPVSAEGILLPPEDFSLAETAGYLKITGVRSSPFSEPGKPWNDPLVESAAQLAGLLKHDWKSLDLKSIEVPPRSSDEIDLEQVVFALITRGGSIIVWGKAPELTASDELDSEHKLEQLRNYFADYGSFELPSGPYEIDIRYDKRISRQKLPLNRDARRPILGLH